MTKKVAEAVERLVDEIYTVDQKEISECFVCFLNALEEMLGTEQCGINHVNEILINLQEAYLHKDYIRMSDILLEKLR